MKLERVRQALSSIDLLLQSTGLDAEGSGGPSTPYSDLMEQRSQLLNLQELLQSNGLTLVLPCCFFPWSTLSTHHTLHSCVSSMYCGLSFLLFFRFWDGHSTPI